MIKLKAKETLQNVGKYTGQYRYVLLAETYSRLSEERVISEASLRAGMPKSALRNAYDAIASVIGVWATEGHSVTVPGLGTMRFAVNAKSVATVDEVGAGLITSRKIIFTPSVDVKKELSDTAISITCYDRNGNVIKNVTSSDEGNVEDSENQNDDSQGGDNQGNQDSGNQEQETVKYRITFNFSDNTEDTADYEAGATISYPEPTSGYKWPDDKPTAMPAQNVSVTEVKIATGGNDGEDESGF